MYAFPVWKLVTACSFHLPANTKLVKADLIFVPLYRYWSQLTSCIYAKIPDSGQAMLLRSESFSKIMGREYK